MNGLGERVVVYSSPFCGYCAAAKRLLANKGVRYIEIDVLMDHERKREMIERSGKRTVPQIFIDGRHVGGFDDLSALEASGELDRLLVGAGGAYDGTNSPMTPQRNNG
jgi:glutaredoxin 3